MSRPPSTAAAAADAPREVAQRMVDYINASWTPWHATGDPAPPRSIAPAPPSITASIPSSRCQLCALASPAPERCSTPPFREPEEAKRQLLAAGFVQLSERDEWALRPGGRYFFTRNMSTLVAFAVGAKYTSGEGFAIVGAHTDSPCLRLKPSSKLTKVRPSDLSVGCMPHYCVLVLPYAPVSLPPL